MDCLCAFLVYLSISVIAHSFVFERWSVIDSIYFAVVTFTTIGYGDFSPTSPAGRAFCVVFALGGVSVLAIGLGVVGAKIIESEVQQITKAEDEIVKDVFRIFQPTKSKEDRQASYYKNSKSSSTGSVSHLAECDDPLYTFRQNMAHAVHPCHTIRERCRRCCQMLARYLPSLTPLLLAAFFFGHFEDWSWIDVAYYCTVTVRFFMLGRRPCYLLISIVLTRLFLLNIKRRRRPLAMKI